VGNPANNEFDPKAFLAKVGTGKTILKLEKNQHVFEQGDVADTVFYTQKGKVKLTVLSDQGKEAVVGILEPGQFFGEGCLNGHPWAAFSFARSTSTMSVVGTFRT
jgi:CRP/FNR family cyclic AMP-dependent transcriptional regulator